MAWQALKSEAEQRFKAEDYAAAANGYSSALAALRQQDGTAEEQAKLLANRCAALQRLGDWDHAVKDALEACELAPNWEKGKLTRRRSRCLPLVCRRAFAFVLNLPGPFACPPTTQPPPLPPAPLAHSLVSLGHSIPGPRRLQCTGDGRL